jgi:hypothetical protein
MIQQQPIAKDLELWHLFWQKEISYLQTRQNFLYHCIDKMTVLKKALQNPSERGTALRLLEYLDVEERQMLFNDLVDLASVAHSDIALVRQVILSLPKDWLLANIEASTEPLLENGTYEEYRRLLELYIDIDLSVGQRLVKRALEHEDPDIREVGEDMQKYFQEKEKALVSGR